MVSPEQGQKIPETAIEVQPTTTETTETSSDIPNDLDTNCTDNQVVQYEGCNGNNSEESPKKVPNDAFEHEPGKVHTV